MDTSAIALQANEGEGFTAQWPKHLDPALESTCSKIGRIFWNIISVIIFPIGIYRLVGSWIHHRVMSAGVVPGNKLNSIQSLVGLLGCFLSPSSYNGDLRAEGKHCLKCTRGEQIQLTAPDGAKLEGIYIPGANTEKAIVFAGGNGQQWEGSLPDLMKLARYGVPIIMLNPRGTGKSQGACYEEGYSLDVYTAMDYFIREKKIKPKNILAVGHSFGGATSTCAAAMLQEKYPDQKISAINIRSFSTLDLTARALTRKSGFLSGFARWYSFDLNPIDAWEKLKGKKCLFYHPKDHVIPHAASLVKKVRERNLPTDKIIRMQEDLSSNNSHNRRFTKAELQELDAAVFGCLQLSSIEKPTPNFENFLYKPSRDCSPLAASRIMPRAVGA